MAAEEARQGPGPHRFSTTAAGGPDEEFVIQETGTNIIHEYPFQAALTQSVRETDKSLDSDSRVPLPLHSGSLNFAGRDTPPRLPNAAPLARSLVCRRHRSIHASHAWWTFDDVTVALGAMSRRTPPVLVDLSGRGPIAKHG